MIGSSFTILDEIDSTNNYAKAQALQGKASDGAAFFAHLQTAGRGQRGRSWTGEKYQNIALSIILGMTEFPIDDQFFLSMTVALSVQDTLAAYIPEGIKLKWPNDIYWQHQKTTGILIENTLLGSKWQWAIVGIGMNVNQTIFPKAIEKKATSLKNITGTDFDCISLAKELCEKVQSRLYLFRKHKRKILLKSYNDQLFKRGEKANFKYKEEIFTGTIEQVDDTGHLWISGAPKPYFTFGEIEMIL